MAAILEAFGMSFLEAAAGGCPFIGRGCGVLSTMSARDIMAI